MATLRNLPTDQPKQFKDLIDIKENQIISMSLTTSDDIDMVVLSFPKGESISEETYFFDTLYYIIEGKLKYTDADNEFILYQGDVYVVKANKGHALECLEDLKILQISINK